MSRIEPSGPSLRPAHPATARLADEAFYAGDPFPAYAALRSEAPVAWDDAGGYWVVTSQPEVLAVSRDPATFCSAQGILTFEIGVEYPSPPTMMHTDPPDHTRYRKLVQPAFSPAAIRAIEPFVREQAARLVAALPDGEPVEIVGALAAPLPLLVISRLLGIPEDEWETFLRWSDATIPDAGDFTLDERMALMGEMNAYLLEAARTRRGNPVGDDVVSVLANTEIDGERLSDEELVMFLNQLLVAGNETTRNLISGGLWALAEAPGEWARLRADRSLVPSAVEEALRWTSPVVAFMRTATRDTELRGVAIGAGEPVLMVYAAANRDPEIFGPDAEQFRVDRNPNPQVALGFGPHFCIGAALARLEGVAVLERLLDRFETMAPTGPIDRTPSAIIAGVRQATLTLS